MTYLDVAKKDFRDASRSRALWALTALFVLFLAGFAYLGTLFLTQGSSDPSVSSLDFVTFLLGPAALLIPITGLVISYKSIAGEVESGSAKLLLSLPHSRRDTVIGKVLGRSAVLAVSILAGLVLALIVIVALYDEFDPVVYLVFSIFTLLFGLVYIAIGVGISATSQDSGRAMILVTGFYVLFEIIWGFVPNGVYYLLNGKFSPEYIQTPGGGVILDAPGWFFFLQRLSPSAAFNNATRAFTDSTFTIAPALDPTPFYLSEWASVAVLLFWLLAVPAVGTYLFNRADL